MKMFLEILLLVAALLVVGYLGFHYAKTVLAPAVNKFQTGSVCFEKNCFQVELATTEAVRDQGLMYRKELNKDKGMLFVFDKEGIYPFWMKNTLIPLDMIWINNSGKVVFMAQNVQPCKSLICPSIIPSGSAKYVLEVNAGVCIETGIKVGDNGIIK